MNKLKTGEITIFLVFFLFFSPSIKSEENILKMEDAVKLARANNPSILAARKKWEASRAKARQEMGLANPRLDLERMYAPKGKNIISGAEEKNIALSQEIPFPTSLYYKNRVAGFEARAEEEAYQAKIRDVVARVKNAYAMLYVSRTTVQTYQELSDFMRQFSKTIEGKYTAGKASQADVLKAQVELTKMLAMLNTLKKENALNEAMLNTLLNQPANTPVTVETDLSASLPNLPDLNFLGIAMENRPELSQAALETKRGQNNLSLCRSEWLPDLMLTYRQRDMMNGPDSRDAILGLSLPLWFWRQGALVSQARAERDMAEAEYTDMKNVTNYDVKKSVLEAENALQIMAIYKTSVLPQAESILQVSEAAYRSDRLSFLDVLDSVRTRLNLELEYAQLQANYVQAIASLEQLIGKELTDVKS